MNLACINFLFITLKKIVIWAKAIKDNLILYLGDNLKFKIKN